METKEVIASILADGKSKLYKDIVVKSASVSTPSQKEDSIMDSKSVNVDYLRVTFNLEENVVSMVANPDNPNEFIEGETHFIPTTTYTVAGAMRNNPKLASIANHCIKNAESFDVIFPGSKITIMQEWAEAGTYTNPFTGRESELRNNTFITHIIDIKLGEEGNDWVKTLKRAMLGLPC